jgi:hypothetical protein
MKFKASKKFLNKNFSTMVGAGEGYKRGFVDGINYIIASDPDLFDLYGEVEWWDLEGWGMAQIIEEAIKKTLVEAK